jgi:hypothetical protein
VTRRQARDATTVVGVVIGHLLTGRTGRAIVATRPRTAQANYPRRPMPAPRSIVDADRYPISDLDAPAARAIIDRARCSLAERGVAILPGFVCAEAVDVMAEHARASKSRAHLEDVWGTPYLDLPDESVPDGHPRRTSVHSLTWVLAYDLVPPNSPARLLYEWDGLREFLSEVLERRPLYRMNDPLGALNVTLMDEGHVQGWHYDSTDFVVSLAIQASVHGGEFECAPAIRSAHDEHYDDVAAVLRGDAAEFVEVYPMTPGTLMVFMGRNSIHRVAPVQGDRSRIVALFAYDTTPDANSSDLLKLVRYGRTEPIAPSATA